MNNEYVSAYAIAKICGCNDSFNDFKTKYDQYREEIKESLPKEKKSIIKRRGGRKPIPQHKTFLICFNDRRNGGKNFDR